MNQGTTDYLVMIQNYSSDAFKLLPMLVSSFFFLYGSLTSNINLLVFFLTSITGIPSAMNILHNFSNIFSFFKEQKWIDIIKLVVSLGVLVFLRFGSFMLTGEMPESNSSENIFFWFAILSLFVHLILDAFVINKQNPFLVNAQKASQICEPTPLFGNDVPRQVTPSYWVASITFFTSFLATNAFFLYNNDPPTLNMLPTTGLSDKKIEENKAINARQKADYDTKLAQWQNRSISIGVLSIVVGILLITARFTLTDCEAPFQYSILPILFMICVGFFSFYFAYKTCGLNAIDLLGFAPGFNNPKIGDNPVICMA